MGVDKTAPRSHRLLNKNIHARGGWATSLQTITVELLKPPKQYRQLPLWLVAHQKQMGREGPIAENTTCSEDTQKAPAFCHVFLIATLTLVRLNHKAVFFSFITFIYLLCVYVCIVVATPVYTHTNTEMEDFLLIVQEAAMQTDGTELPTVLPSCGSYMLHIY